MNSNNYKDYNSKINQEDEEEEDELMQGILVQKLPVSQFKNYDPDLPPTCGEDYLRRVQ